MKGQGSSLTRTLLAFAFAVLIAAWALNKAAALLLAAAPVLIPVFAVALGLWVAYRIRGANRW